MQALLSTSAESLLNASRQVFQIDANLGAAAGIAEMLLQSQAGEIAFLPALPSAWPEGHFNGLRARGNVEVDASWANGKAVSGTLRPAVSGDVRIRPPRGQRISRIQSGDRTVKAAASDGVWLVRLEPGQVYRLTFE